MLAQYTSTVCDMLVSAICGACDGAGLEAMIVAGSCIFFLALSQWQTRKSKVGPGKSCPPKYADALSGGKSVKTRRPLPLSSYSKSSEEVREKLDIATVRSGRTFRQAVQGLERYKAMVWERGVDLQGRFSPSQARAYYLNLASCLVQVGPQSLPAVPHTSESENSTTRWIRHLLADIRKFGFPHDNEFYLIMMKMFANEHLWKDVLTFHKEITADGVEMDQSVLITFMNAAVAVDDTFWAMHYFRALAKLAPPSMRTYMTVLRVYVKQKDWEGAVKLCEEMESLGSPPDNLVLNQVLGLCVSQGQMAAAEKLLKQWESIIDVISCNTVLKGFTHAGSLPSAEALLKQMMEKGPSPNLISFNTMMDCSFRACQLLEKTARGQDSSNHRISQLKALSDRPWKLLEQLTEFGLEPDRYTCSTIVKGMHLAGGSAEEIDRAIVLLNRLGPAKLQSTGDLPSDRSRPSNLTQNIRLVEVLFNTLLDICSSSQDLERMIQIFEMMKEFEVMISAVTFGTLIKAFGQAAKVNRCHDVWTEMRNTKTAPTVVTFGCYIDACIRNKELDYAEKIFYSMSEDDIKPNAVIFTSLIRGLASAGQSAQAFALYRRMRAAGVEPTSVTFNSVLDMVARRLAEPEILQEVINDMKDVMGKPDAVAYCILIKASCNSGHVDNALLLWRQLRLQGITFDESTFNVMLLTCARADRASEVEEIFGDMSQLGMVPNNGATSIVVKMYGRMRLPNKALEMLDIIERSNGEKPNLHLYTCMIQACVANKVGKRSWEVFERMLRQDIEPDAVVYDAVINGCIQMEQFEHAMAVVRHAAMLPQPGNSPRTGEHPWSKPSGPCATLDALSLSRPVKLQKYTFENLAAALKKNQKEQWELAKELHPLRHTCFMSK